MPKLSMKNHFCPPQKNQTSLNNFGKRRFLREKEKTFGKFWILWFFSLNVLRYLERLHHLNVFSHIFAWCVRKRQSFSPKSRRNFPHFCAVRTQMKSSGLTFSSSSFSHFPSVVGGKFLSSSSFSISAFSGILRYNNTSEQKSHRIVQGLRSG